MADNIVPRNTKIYYTYGTKEDTKTLTKLYLKHFPEAEMIPVDGMHPEEFFIFHPYDWVDMMKHLLKRRSMRIKM